MNVQQAFCYVAVRKLSNILFPKTSYLLKCMNMFDLPGVFLYVSCKGQKCSECSDGSGAVW